VDLGTGDDVMSACHNVFDQRPRDVRIFNLIISLMSEGLESMTS